MYEGELARRGRTRATRQKYREVLWPFADHFGRKTLQDVTTDNCRRFSTAGLTRPNQLSLWYVSVVRGFLADSSSSAMRKDGSQRTQPRP
jgi:hypothetical protein